MSRVWRLMRRHWLLLLVVALAAIVRIAVGIAYSPALMWTDSWQFLYATDLPGGFAPDKPNGYPLVLRVLRSFSESLTLISTLQHIAGLAGGVLMYVLLSRRSIPSGWAAAATGVVLLDSYAIALEQHVLAEALFVLVLLIWAYLAVGSGQTTLAVVGAGLALAAAATIRGVAAFAVPVWLIYCFWQYPDTRRRLGGLAGVALPLLLYAVLHNTVAGGFGLTQMDGWALYSRVAEIADCADIDPPPQPRALCPPGSQRAARLEDPVAYYQFSPSSPIRRVYGDLFTLPSDERRVANGELRDFATDVIEDRPLRFAELLLSDTAKFFRPGAMATLRSFDDPITLPERPRPVPRVARAARDAYAPDYVPSVGRPSDLLVSYQRWIHTPRWLMGALAAAALVALLATLLPATRAGISNRREIFLLAGAACAMLLGSALNHFEVRYLVSVVPLLVSGGVLAFADLWRTSIPRRAG